MRVRAGVADDGEEGGASRGKSKPVEIVGELRECAVHVRCQSSKWRRGTRARDVDEAATGRDAPVRGRASAGHRRSRRVGRRTMQRDVSSEEKVKERRTATANAARPASSSFDRFTPRRCDLRPSTSCRERRGIGNVVSQRLLRRRLTERASESSERNLVLILLVASPLPSSRSFHVPTVCDRVQHIQSQHRVRPRPLKTSSSCSHSLSASARVHVRCERTSRIAHKNEVEPFKIPKKQDEDEGRKLGERNNTLGSGRGFKR